MKFFTEHPANLVLLLTAAVSGFLLLWPILMRRGAQALSMLEATQLINRKNAVVIDLRDAKQFAAGHALNARNVMPDALADSAALPKNKETPVLLICEAGQRSAASARALAKLGYAAVHPLAGGHAAWVAAGFPVQK